MDLRMENIMRAKFYNIYLKSQVLWILPARLWSERNILVFYCQLYSNTNEMQGYTLFSGIVYLEIPGPWLMDYEENAWYYIKSMEFMLQN